MSSIPMWTQNAKANQIAYEELGIRIAALLAGISNVVQKTPQNRLLSTQANIEDVLR
jgi:hypothetical protein